MLYAPCFTAAIGVFDGERLVASKVGSRFVKSRHKKGGSSANRFRRRGEEQARALIGEAAETAVRVLEPWRDRVEFVAFGGDLGAITEVLETSPDLGWLSPRSIPRFFHRPGSAPARARAAALRPLLSRAHHRVAEDSPLACNVPNRH